MNHHNRISVHCFLFWVVPCCPWKKQLNKYDRKVRVKNNNKESLKLHHWLVRSWRSYKPRNTQWLFQCMHTWVRQSSWPVARRRTKVVTNQNRGGQRSPVADLFQQDTSRGKATLVHSLTHLKHTQYCLTKGAATKTHTGALLLACGSADKPR